MSQPSSVITSKNLSQVKVQPQAVPVPIQAPPDEPIIAKPLVSPDFTGMIKQKNKSISLRWVECRANQGQRYHQMKALGFVNATESDVVAPGHMLKDGAIKYGDLILMKIDRRDYEGALKYNQEKAEARMRPNAALAQGQSELKQALGGASMQPELSKKISVFVPGEKETEALLGKD